MFQGKPSPTVPGGLRSGNQNAVKFFFFRKNFIHLCSKYTTMQTADLVRAIIYSHHGWAVADQFEDTFGGESFEEQNDNALRYIRETVEQLLRSELLSETAHDELQSYRDDLEDYLAKG